MAALTFVPLVLVAIIVATASAQGESSSAGGISNCCRAITTTQVHRENLISYYKQGKPSCPIEAVVFTRVRGKKICSDLNQLWTRTSMAFLDGKA